MASVGRILLFAVAITGTLVFCAMVLSALITGRLKMEPSQPWTTFRERPARFVGLVLVSLLMAGLWAVATYWVACTLIR